MHSSTCVKTKQDENMKKLVAFITLATIAPATLAGTAAPLPEPSTWALFGAAAIAVLLLSKFKK
jgi:PEP-CTERM motif